MPFWSGETLENRLAADNLVSPFDPKLIDCAAYTLRMGDSAFLTHDGKESSGLFEVTHDKPVRIPPGQFAFLLTREVVRVPADAVAFISIKARRKLDGLINVSGFHVDPGWDGKLIFGVFNAGPQLITIGLDEKLFLIFYAALDQESTKIKRLDSSQYERIPTDIMQKMSGEVPSLFRVSEAVRKLEKDASRIEAELQSRIAKGEADIQVRIGKAEAESIGKIARAEAIFETRVGKAEKQAIHAMLVAGFTTLITLGLLWRSLNSSPSATEGPKASVTINSPIGLDKSSSAEASTGGEFRGAPEGKGPAIDPAQAVKGAEIPKQ